MCIRDSLATMPENGARNGALLAVRILGINDDEINKKYLGFVKKQHDDVISADQQLQEEGWESILSNT